MTLINAKWQHRKQFDWDGVQYDVLTCEISNGVFQAAWVCLDCCEEGALAPSGKTVDEVLRLSRIGARVHHLLIHGCNVEVN